MTTYKLLFHTKYIVGKDNISFPIEIIKHQDILEKTIFSDFFTFEETYNVMAKICFFKDKN